MLQYEPFSLAGCDSSPQWESPWQKGQLSSSPSTARRSQPISEKLPALAKASPFRERWHGEAVTEKDHSGTNPLSAYGDSSPEGGEPLAERQLYAPAKLRRRAESAKLTSLPKPLPSGEVAGEAGRRGCSRTNPLSAYGDSSPKVEPWRNRHASPVNGPERSIAEISALANLSPSRERWHGEAVTERVELPPQPSFGPAERPAYSRSTSIPIVFSLFSYFIIEMMFAQVN